MWDSARLASAAPAVALILWAAPARGAQGPDIDWVTISSGVFTMGLPFSSRTVAVKAFQIARTPVTNRQYQACVDAGACTPQAAVCGDAVNKPADHPVVCVDWRQAAGFSKWAGGRLPTEAEWEYAARSAGMDWLYPWGDEPPTCDRLVKQYCGDDHTEPVCSRPLGNTRQGLCDMVGNVQEWVDGSCDGHKGIRRGGGWESDAEHVAAATRTCYQNFDRDPYAGFRPVRPVR